MLDDLKVGEFLELPDSKQHLMDKIASLGNIRIFILSFDPLVPVPRWPFLILLKESDKLGSIRTWFESKNCQGVFIRQTATPCWNKISIYSEKLIYIDFNLSKYKSNFKALQVLLDKPNVRPLVHIDIKKSSCVLHNFLQITQETQKAIFLRPRILDYPTADFTDWHELENFYPPIFKQELNLTSSIRFSIIIPHYNSPYFVTNVLRHLAQLESKKSDYEVLLVDDFSKESDFTYIRSFIRQHLPLLPIRIFRWPKPLFLKSGVRAFRAGASRNWGAHYARGDFLFFLDSDMLVPTDFISQLKTSMEKFDVVQFKRVHIPVHLSSEATHFAKVIQSPELFVEESRYWNQLFEAPNWTELKDHWKFCCTYGLGMKKELFQHVGRIRRNFIQYGFEDTDLGYRLNRAGAKMTLNKTPLLHLTAQKDRSQTRYYQFAKMKKLKPMAKIFYCLNMDQKLYPTFRNLVD